MNDPGSSSNGRRRYGADLDPLVASALDRLTREDADFASRYWQNDPIEDLVGERTNLIDALVLELWEGLVPEATRQEFALYAVGGVGWQENPDDLEGTPRSRVVGVVGDTLDRDLAEEPTPIFYYPVLEGGAANLFWVPSQLEVIARTDGDPLALADAVREAIWSIDANLPIANVRTMADVVDTSTLNTRFTMTLLVMAAAVALFLGAIGLYGTIAYIVGQRTREIGVRMALGAARGDVATMVLRQAATVAVGGLAAGLIAAFAVSRFLDSLLFDVSATDPMTYAAMAALLLFVALAASYLPARRASRLDPVDGLRAE